MYGDRRAVAGRLAAVHAFHRRVVALATVAATSILWACTNTANNDGDNSSTRTVEETLVPPDDTLPGGKVTSEYVVARVLQSVSDGVGLLFPDDANHCITEALLKTVSAADLAAIGTDGIIGEQPDAVQNEIFAAFDGCVSGDLMGRIGAPTLVSAGATPAEAECVYQLGRERLGFTGLYRFGATDAGEAEPNAVLTAAVAGVYHDCGVDPAKLTAPTLPTDTRPPPTTLFGETTTSAPSTSPGETTTTVVLTTTSGPPITLTRPSTVPDVSSTTLFPQRPVPTVASSAPLPVT